MSNHQSCQGSVYTSGAFHWSPTEPGQPSAGCLAHFQSSNSTLARCLTQTFPPCCSRRNSERCPTNFRINLNSTYPLKMSMKLFTSCLPPWKRAERQRIDEDEVIRCLQQLSLCPFSRDGDFILPLRPVFTHVVYNWGHKKLKLKQHSKSVNHPNVPKILKIGK